MIFDHVTTFHPQKKKSFAIFLCNLMKVDMNQLENNEEQNDVNKSLPPMPFNALMASSSMTSSPANTTLSSLLQSFPKTKQNR
jgi:hypothetical protein